MQKLSLALVTLVPLVLALDEPASPEATPKPARVAVIGASVSQGFGLSQELEVNCTLSPFLDTALRLPHEEILNLGDGFMFQDAVRLGAQQLEKALAIEPTLVIAADFPFWFGYGSPDDLQARMRRLERGLKLLEEVQCPLLLGDFPDMSPALKGVSPLTGGNPIVSPQQIPSLEQQKQLNSRLREWAEGRENVHVFAMSHFVLQLRNAEPLEVRGNVIDAEAKQALLQADLLHPTVKGTALFTVLVLDQLVREGVIAEDQVEWSVEKIEAGAWEQTRAARDKLQERRRRREERKRKLEERKKAREEQQQGQQGALDRAA